MKPRTIFAVILLAGALNSCAVLTVYFPTSSGVALASASENSP